MKVNFISNNAIQFSKVHILTKNMRGVAKEKIADDLGREISYSDEISKLDAKGIDVYILENNKYPETKVSVYFYNTRSEHIYEINGRNHVESKIIFPNGPRFDGEYDTNSDGVIDAARLILAGKCKTIKPKPETLEKIRDSVWNV